MVDRVFLTWPFAATNAPTPMTLPNRLALSVNVKDFGAVGDGSANDQPPIQAAFNAAFTASGTPHGTNSFLNREVFIPSGNYRLTSPLTLTQVKGGKITGAGRQATALNNTAGGPALITNGLEKCFFSNFSLSATGAYAVLDLDWDNSGGVGLSGNTFLSMDIGSYPPACTYGVRIANAGFGGSNNVFLCCFINANATALATLADSALANAVFGGNMGQNGTGILVNRGSVTAVNGVGLQEQTAYDIQINSTAADGMAVVGCRSESNYFFKATTAKPITITGSGQPGNRAVFVFLDGCPATIEGCFAGTGVVSIRNAARVSLVSYATNFATAAWLDAPAATLALDTATPPGVIELENITYDAAGTKIHTFKQRKTNHLGAILTQDYQVL
jgi:hypothetical protein